MLASALGVVIVSVVAGILSLVAMISMVLSLNSLSKSDAVVVRPGTYLTVDLDHVRGDRTGSGLRQSFSTEKSVGLLDAVEAIRAASDDANVCGLLLKGDGSMSWASLEELRAAVAEFSSGGKPVVSYATSYSQGGYYLCSLADSVCLHPAGMLDFRGLGGQVLYYKDLLDKLGVEMQLIRPESCSYKSAGEVYTLNRMSDANREQIRAYLSSVWRTAVGDISTSRDIPTADLNAIADNLDGCLADDALKVNLVDKLCFEEDVRHMLKTERFGGRHMMPLEKYAKNIKVKSQARSRADRIAVIYAEGNVMDGSSKGMDEGVYGDDIVKALRKAGNDDDVKAIVLRVNSPGGQATASESMTHAVMEARSKKPVIVSMGDLAASAGYEMSCMADVIVAQPMTITGSIGVFGTIPNVGKMMSKKLGINADTVATNRNATGLSVLRPLSPAAMAMMTRNVEEFYKVFVGRVSEGRHMTYDAVHQVARGRVWTGADAVGIGLVDTLGGFDLAVRIAAERAGIDTWSIKEYPEEKDVWAQLSEMFGDDESDFDLAARFRLAMLWRTAKRGEAALPSRIDSEIGYITTAEGVQARMPFFMIED